MMPAKTRLYKILWVVNDKVKEEINFNNPRPKAITTSLIRLLSKTTHKTGELLPELVK